MLSHYGLWLWEHTPGAPQLRHGGGSEKASQTISSLASEGQAAGCWVEN